LELLRGAHIKKPGRLQNVEEKPEVISIEVSRNYVVEDARPWDWKRRKDGRGALV